MIIMMVYAPLEMERNCESSRLSSAIFDIKIPKSASWGDLVTPYSRRLEATLTMAPGDRKYDALRENLKRQLQARFDADLAAGMQAIAELERLAIDPLPMTASGIIQITGPDLFDERESAEVYRGESWADAIDAVLAQAPRGLTVRQIVDVLKAHGRSFPPGGRDHVAVGSALYRQGEARGWISIGKRPQRWRKHRKEEGPS